MIDTFAILASSLLALFVAIRSSILENRRQSSRQSEQGRADGSDGG